MLNPARCFTRALLVTVFAALLPCGSLFGQVIYTNSFQGNAPGPEWSDQTISTTPKGARRFLGPFGAETVTLDLTSLPTHSAITVEFDLFIIQSWDGSDITFGPDVWAFGVPGERNLVRATFSNGTLPQAYPGLFPYDNGPGLRGTVERSTLGYPAILGYTGSTDSVYRVTRSFAHSGGSLRLAFTSGQDSDVDNESWGIDDISVSVRNPEGGVIEFAAAVYYAPEGATNAVLTLKRSGTVDLPASVEFSTADGTAGFLNDYAAASGVVEFAAGEREKEIVVPLINDTLAEPRDEWFAVTLTNASSVAVLGSPASARVAIVDDDTTDVHFRKDLGSPLAYEGGSSQGAAWGDYDGDGYLDLFVPNFGTGKNFLYHNNGGKGFTKVTTGAIATEEAIATGGAWADYDNDGDLDLFVATFGPPLLYRNDGAAGFTVVPNSGLGDGFLLANGGAWGDYNNDGNVDLYVITDFGPNLLFRNNGNGTFTKILSGAPVTDEASSTACAWGDYDNDGRLDLFVANRVAWSNFLYHNNGNGSFTRVPAAPIATDDGDFYSCSWVDANNDGLLDLFVAAFGTRNFLYLNRGDGVFQKATGPLANDSGYAIGSGWADADNDGVPDLYVGHAYQFGSLYMSTGSGAFLKKTHTELTRDYNPASGVVWADVNRDGFMDLFLANFRQQDNNLYLNLGTKNNHLTVRLRGTLSNGSGIGAKVKVMTLKEGVERWQLREISGGNGPSQNAMEASFGLGDATVVEKLQVTWPSGAVQSWMNVTINQLLTVVEAPQLHATAPSTTLSLEAKLGARVVLEASADLIQWIPVLDTNAPAATFPFEDPEAEARSQRFYRAKYLR